MSKSNPVAFAISGGASKGAYEAGLIWGLVEINRQVEQAHSWSLGGERRPIQVMSVAGTSAGGINALLGALAWSVNPEKGGGFPNRIDDNIFRDVWLIPDVNSLLPPDANSPRYLKDDALLSRQDLVTVSRELREKWRKPGTFRPGLRLPLGVTVTRVTPDTMRVSGVEVKNQRFYIPFELQIQEDGSAKFFFDLDHYPTLSDPAMILMPWPADGAPFSISDQQVEDAILTTSAFPTGFGRKRLQYCREKSFDTMSNSNAPASVNGPASTDAGDAGSNKLVCPEGYELMEAEFADGGLFYNLPVGLSRLLAESSVQYKKHPVPVNYLYLDPDRQRYETRESRIKTACEGKNPPPACREMTFDLFSEAAVLGGAVGTARRYELFREMTSDNWRLNLSELSRTVAAIMDAGSNDVACDSVLPFFEDPIGCSDRLRYSARLLEQAYRYRMAPVTAPLSVQALQQAEIATTCRPLSDEAVSGYVAAGSTPAG